MTLDMTEAVALYQSGKTMQETARALHTSVTTLYKHWPPDVPRRQKGPQPGTRRAAKTPDQAAAALIASMDPDDLADTVRLLQEALARRYWQAT